MFRRVLLIAGGAIAGVIGLGMAISPPVAVELGAVLVIASVCAVKLPTRRRAVLWLTVAAVLLVGVLNVAPTVVGAGPLAILAVLGGLAAILLTGRRGLRRPPPARGAAWVTKSELEEAGFFPPHGWPLGAIGKEVLRLPMKLERENILVAAAPGSGKTAGPAMLSILSEADQPPELRRTLIICDPKDEVTRDTLPRLQKTHQCTVFDPGSSHPDGVVSFDPLSTLPPSTDDRFVGEVQELAQAWFEATRGGSERGDEASFWDRQAGSLLEAMFLAFIVAHPKGTFVQLADWIRALNVQTFQELLDQSTNSVVHASAEKLRALGLNERTVGPVYADVLQRFDLLIDPRVRRAMSGPPIVWSSMLTEEPPAALYLRIGAQDAKRLSPLISMVLGQLYREVTKVASRYPNNVLPRELRLIVDEAGNLPHIRGLDTALATLRSYGVGHYLFVQNLSQLDVHYGPRLAEAIRNAIVTHVVLGGTAYQDAELFSRRCGEITEHIETESVTANGLRRTKTFGYAPDRRPLISASDLIHMSGHVLISTRGVMPICAELRMYFQDKELLRRLEEDKREYERAQAVKVPVFTLAAPAPPSPAEELTENAPPTEWGPDSALAAPLASTDTGRRPRDVPPPGVQPEEFAGAARSLNIARWSLEDDFHRLFISRVVSDLDALHAEWQTSTSPCSPTRFSEITPEESKASPAYYRYLRGLAVRLEIVDGADDQA